MNKLPAYQITDACRKIMLEVPHDRRIGSPGAYVSSDAPACQKQLPEFASFFRLNLVTGQEMEIELIDSGKPWQNGLPIIFNKKFCDEHLTFEFNIKRIDASIVVQYWRRHNK